MEKVKQIDKLMSCCFISNALEHVAAAIYSQVKDKVEEKETIKDEEWAFQAGAQQATLMLTAIMNAEDKLCDKCSNLEEKIGEQKLIDLVNGYTESFKKSKR